MAARKGVGSLRIVLPAAFLVGVAEVFTEMLAAVLVPSTAPAVRERAMVPAGVGTHATVGADTFSSVSSVANGLTAVDRFGVARKGVEELAFAARAMATATGKVSSSK